MFLSQLDGDERFSPSEMVMSVSLSLSEMVMSVSLPVRW